METQYLDFQYNWENELLRRDCPEDDVMQWLEERSKGRAFRTHGLIGEVYKTKLEELDNGDHIYHIKLKGYSV